MIYDTFFFIFDVRPAIVLLRADVSRARERPTRDWIRIAHPWPFLVTKPQNDEADLLRPDLLGVELNGDPSFLVPHHTITATTTTNCSC